MQHLGDLDVCGLRYAVWLASPEEQPLLAENEGYTDTTRNTILLLDSLPISRLRDRLLHEIVHAFLEASGLDHLLRLGRPGREAVHEQHEEAFIRLLVPALLRFIDANLLAPSPIEGLLRPRAAP